MEADWSAEVGDRLPAIVLPWSGFCDLSGLEPFAIAERVVEARALPALGEALARLNSAGARVRTAKCDVWQPAGDEIDVYEFESTVEESQAGRASYVDVLARDPMVFSSFDLTEVWVRALVRLLAEQPLPHARVEAVIRAAWAWDAAGYGLTLYAFGCGRDQNGATGAWGQALALASAATIATVPVPAGE